jgi:hypothetical protein
MVQQIAWQLGYRFEPKSEDDREPMPALQGPANGGRPKAEGQQNVNDTPRVAEHAPQALRPAQPAQTLLVSACAARGVPRMLSTKLRELPPSCGPSSHRRDHASAPRGTSR